MSIAKRLMLACAGVVVGGLGFTPRANAGMLIDMQLDPNPSSNANYSYISPSSLTQVGPGHYQIQGSQTAGNKFLLFDVYATVTGSQVNSSAPARDFRDTANDATGNFGAGANPMLPSYLAEGVVWAGGTISLSGNTSVLDNVSPRYRGSYAGLVAGDRGQATAQTLVNNANYNNFAQGANSGTPVVANNIQRSLGPIAGDANEGDATAYNNLVTMADTTLNVAGDDGVNAPTNIPILGDPTKASSTFLLGKATLFFGTAGAQGGGTLQVQWIPVSTTVNQKGNQWVEDFITGPRTNAQGLLTDTGDGRGYYSTSGAKSSYDTPTGFSSGNGITLDVIVPEPATLGLFAVGALVCGLRRNRRK